MGRVVVANPVSGRLSSDPVLEDRAQPEAPGALDAARARAHALDRRARLRVPPRLDAGRGHHATARPDGVLRPADGPGRTARNAGGARVSRPRAGAIPGA